MRSIRTKLLLGLLIPLTVVAAFVSLETFFASQKISRDLSDKTLLAASLTILEQVISTNGNLLAEDTLQNLTDNLGDRFFYHVSGPDGAFVTGYSGYPRPPENLTITENEPYFYDGIHLDAPVRVVLVRKDLSDRELNGVTTITTWQRTTQRSNLTLSLFARSLARLVLLVLAAGAIVWIAVRFGLSPLTKLQSAIDQRTPYDLTPIKRAMPVELAGIVSSMNELFARVARSKSNRERFIGDAAHQLRNPIAAIKVQAETALNAEDQPAKQAGLRQILDVSNTSADMINKMLSGATAHAMDRKSEKTFDLSAMLESAVQDAAPLAFESNHEMALDGTQEPIMFRGNETLLREAVSNLIHNAVLYNDPGSLITVALKPGDKIIEISVGDTGEVFDEERFLQLSQPFYIGHDGQSGSGLGLSIAKDIAKSHGGYLTTAPQPGGKTISIMLPRD